MTRPLWQLLLDDPAKLACDECFAVMEYYADRLATSGPGLLPEALEHLRGCPECKIEHWEMLRRMKAG